MSRFECSSCMTKEVRKGAGVYYFNRSTGERASAEELDDYWHLQGCSPNVFDGIEAGIDLNYCAEVVEEDEEVDVCTYFDGTEEEAASLGWTEDEFGTLCPKCAETQSVDRGHYGAQLEGGITEQLLELAGGKTLVNAWNASTNPRNATLPAKLVFGPEGEKFRKEQAEAAVKRFAEELAKNGTAFPKE